MTGVGTDLTPALEGIRSKLAELEHQRGVLNGKLREAEADVAHAKGNVMILQAAIDKNITERNAWDVALFRTEGGC